MKRMIPPIMSRKGGIAESFIVSPFSWQRRDGDAKNLPDRHYRQVYRTVA